MEPGTTLGPYEAVELLGKGGMGEVWAARDTKLDRDVALKILPAELADDPERLERLEREARLLASVDHPNIGAIYGVVETEDGRPVLVLELVEGPTLADRVEAAALPLGEALEVAVEIAEALDAAHAKGVVHRDLKPANVKVADGTVKVLDFGLAKALEMEVDEQGSAESPSASMPSTEEQIIVGTAAYMSPEQARGQPVDRRTDVWSFGCVLYEMLTGEPAFERKTVSDTLAAVLVQEPDWERLPQTTPAPIRRLLRRCLDKERRRRLHAIADARIEIEDVLEERSRDAAAGSEGPAEPAGPAGPEAAADASQAPTAGWLGTADYRALVPWALAAGLAIALLLALLLGSPAGGDGDRAVRRATVEAAEDARFALAPFGPSFVLSPDGSRLVYVGLSAEEGEPRLWVRDLASFASEPLAGTEGAMAPFFSPDGTEVGFFTGGELRAVPIDGGTPRTLSPADGGRSADWGTDGTIVFSTRTADGLMRVADSGGTPRTLTSLDTETGETAHSLPQLLPDGEHVLFTVLRDSVARPADVGIGVASLETGEVQAIHDGGMAARYLPGGNLVWARPEPGRSLQPFGSVSLVGAPFDLGDLEILGDPVPLIERVTAAALYGSAQFTVASDGTLAYSDVELIQRVSLVRIDRQGAVEALPFEPQPYGRFDLSPDGRRLAVDIRNAGESDIWIGDVATGALTRFTFEGSASSPVWTPDGSRITYVNGADSSIVWKPADGGPEETLISSETVPAAAFPSAWSPDGRTLALGSNDPQTGADVWIASFASDGGAPAGPATLEPFARSPGREANPAFSPDGRWIAYEAAARGSDDPPEIHLRPFPAGEARHRVSGGGGEFPTWNPQGGELFFQSAQGIRVAEVAPEGDIARLSPQPVVEWQLLSGGARPPSWMLMAPYVVAPDGRSFLVAFPERSPGTDRIRVVFGWADELRQRLSESS